MNLFQTNFLTKTANLMKEAFKLKKYKAMHPALAVFTMIFMLPWMLVSFALTAVLAVLGFIFELFAAPARYLHGLTKSEGNDVKHATQAVIYLISWPVIFALYAAMIPLMLCILVTYALFSIVTYAWSLCGFKFHLFPNELDDISIEVTKRYFALPLILVIVCAVIKLVAFVVGTCMFARLWELRLEQYFPALYFTGAYPIFLGVQVVFTFLFSLIGFANRDKKDAE